MNASGSTQDAATSLRASLVAETDAMRHFLAALTAEAAALERLDDSSVAALGDSTQRKQDCAQALAAAQAHRNRHLQQAGLPETPDGLRQAAHAVDDCTDLVDTLLSLTQAAAEQNARNGIAIGIFQQHTQQALTELRAMAGIEHLYDAHGRTQPSSQPASTRLRIG